jgi:hypothetical protein
MGMNIDYIIQVLEYRLTSLNQLKITALHSGDLQRVVEIESDITSTEITLHQLRNNG